MKRLAADLYKMTLITAKEVTVEDQIKDSI